MIFAKGQIKQDLLSLDNCKCDAEDTVHSGMTGPLKTKKLVKFRYFSHTYRKYKDWQRSTP